MIGSIQKYIFLTIMLIVSLCSSSSFALTVDTYTNDNMLTSDGKGRSESIEVAATGTNAKEDLITVIKSAINRVLGILALITLCILLRGGFQMVTAAGDDKKYDAGFTYVKQAGGGLAMIGVAWFIVSIIFFVIKLATT